VPANAQTNIGPRERWISAIAGAALAAYGATRLPERKVAGIAMTAAGGALIARGAVGRSPLYRALGIHTVGPCGQQTADHEVSVIEETVTVNRPAADLYRYWRDLERLPDLVPEVDSVRQIDARRSRWRMRGPFGWKTRWDAEIVDQIPDELIRWRARNRSSIREGTVQFHPLPGDRGTEVRVELRYPSPRGPIGPALAWMAERRSFTRVHSTLRRFKQIAETGEVATTDAQPRGQQKLTNYD
jgi:uncharacterized membrane protein